MSDKLEEFKQIFRGRMINQILESGTPPMKHWPVPPLFRATPSIMIALLSERGWELYSEMDDKTQKVAIDYVENCGQELADIVGCELFEDWDKDPILISDEKIQEINDKYNLNVTDEINEVVSETEPVVSVEPVVSKTESVVEEVD